jgi:hypothetical protein
MILKKNQAINNLKLKTKFQVIVFLFQLHMNMSKMNKTHLNTLPPNEVSK